MLSIGCLGLWARFDTLIGRLLLCVFGALGISTIFKRAWVLFGSDVISNDKITLRFMNLSSVLLKFWQETWRGLP